MNDSNLGTEEPARPCTNENSIHLPQRNGVALLDRRKSVGGSSTSVEFLFSACGYVGSTKFKKCNSKKWILANSFLKPTDKIVGSMTNRTYSCANYEKFYVVCNSSNIICLILCSNFFMQYVGETTQQLNIRFGTHRASLSEKIKSDSCKWLAEHFSTGICKNAKYFVQIIEKWPGNGRASRGAIDLGEAVLRKREIEWMLKLRTVYP